MGGGFHSGLSFPSHLSPRSSLDEQIKCPLCAGRWEVSALREPVHGLAVLCPQRPSLERAQLSRDPFPFLISNGKKRPVSRVTFGGSVLCTSVLSIAQDDQYSASVRRSSLALLSQVTLHRGVFVGTLARIGLELASGDGPGSDAGFVLLLAKEGFFECYRIPPHLGKPLQRLLLCFPARTI